MPWINGRFYANPLFGQAVERARAAESSRPRSEEHPEPELLSSSQEKSAHSAPRSTAQQSQPPLSDHQKNIERKASVGYGETRGLLPQKSPSAKGHNTYDRGNWSSDSFQELQQARRNIMDVSERNPRIHRAEPGDKANAIDKSVWDDNTDAAAQSGGTLPGNHFFIRQAGVGSQRPPKKAGFGRTGNPIRSYGPFVNVGGGDAPKGGHAYIDIYDH
jgi:hypothetical protein